MRKIYNDLFYIPKHGKIREKVMVARVALIAGVMVLCLTAMSFTAYAFFSYNVTSTSNFIEAAIFETNVSIIDSDNVPVDVITSDHKSHKAALKAGNTYTVTLESTTNSTAITGFIIVSSEDCEDSYHTQQLYVDSSALNGESGTITFNLKVTNDTDVIFSSHWGTSTYYDKYKENGEGNRLYITNENIGDYAVEMTIVPKNGKTSGNSDNENESAIISGPSESSVISEDAVTESTDSSSPDDTAESEDEA